MVLMVLLMQCKVRAASRIFQLRCRKARFWSGFRVWLGLSGDRKAGSPLTFMWGVYFLRRMNPKLYLLSQHGETGGPYSIAQLRSMWAAGTTTAEASVCIVGTDDWFTIEALAEELSQKTAWHSTEMAKTKNVIVPRSGITKPPPPLPNEAIVPDSSEMPSKRRFGVLRIALRILLCVLWPLFWLMGISLVRVTLGGASDEARRKALASGMNVHEYASSIAKFEALLMPIGLVVLGVGFVGIWLLTNRRKKS
jgi:hypothetical protein